ncbi:MAG: hypothetical protein ACD_62C00075G0012 [uncultured bacterium]|nr:MAG: hypothetical protein ACD_62C00075G0012 [uncultured bacterium]
MPHAPIPINTFTPAIHDLWANQWFLLTCGDYAKKDFNTMTVAWGSLGVMWSKPFVQVVVRPTRYTFEFLERFDDFTLCSFDKQHQKALTLLGTQSGRDGDKISAAGLTPITSSLVTSPSFEEAQLIIEAKKMYWQDFDPTHFLDPEIEKKYPKKDYHRVYYGEVVAIAKTQSV